MDAENDAPLSPDQVEELLGAFDGGSNAPLAGGRPKSGGRDAEMRGFGGSPEFAPGGTEQLLDQAEADLAAAISSNYGMPGASGLNLSGATPFKLDSFGDDAIESNEEALRLESLQDVELDLRIELGRTELLIDEVLRLKEGSVVPLDKLAGDPVDILVNGRLVARGEVLVLNDNFCVRITEILTPDY